MTGNSFFYLGQVRNATIWSRVKGGNATVKERALNVCDVFAVFNAISVFIVFNVFNVDTLPYGRVSALKRQSQRELNVA
jgi:hypothetical protein